ncbi:hypothetical protein PNI0002_01089 [Streptococcus pneumoniae PNI0002]|nr:hypothetical protein PNI0002_01089 [Streptococcus pneumoniae PNI0002]
MNYMKLWKIEKNPKKAKYLRIFLLKKDKLILILFYFIIM